MNRVGTYLIGPETVLTLGTAVLFWFCARHNSGAGRDVALMERLIWLLPLILTPLAFATVFVPGAKSWWWLGRAAVFSFVAILVCGGRLISGLGPGAKGQDAALILLIVLGAAAVGLATAATGAIVLGAKKPGFAQWFDTHKVLGSVLTLLSAVPIGFVLGAAVTICGTVLLAFFHELFRR